MDPATTVQALSPVDQVSGKDGEIILLSTGRRVQWICLDAFRGYTLITVDHDDEGFECGNPWNLVQLCPEAERKLVRDKKPQACKPPLDVKSIVGHHVFGNEAEVRSSLTDVVSSDCWGVYTTSDDRKIVHKIYYNERNIERHDNFRDSPAYKEQDKKRAAIIDDPTELLQDIANGLTVVCVMGQEELAEVYYFKIGQLYLFANVVYL